MMLIIKNKRELSEKAEEVLGLLKKNLKRKKVAAEIASLEDAEVFIDNREIKVLVKGKSLKNYNRIFFRKVGTSRNLAYIIASLAKKYGIPFIDKFNSEVHSRGKLIQMFLLAGKKLPVPKTYHALSYGQKNIRSAVSFLKLPIVAKATNLGGGKMVYLAKSKKELEKILSKHSEVEMILQEYIGNNFDYRIMVFGNKPGVAEKRVRTKKGEFRNNGSVGARELFFPVSKVPGEILKLAKSAAKIMNVQVAGVDIVTSLGGKNYIFEVNPAPGLSVDVKGSYEIEQFVNYLALWAKKI